MNPFSNFPNGATSFGVPMLGNSIPSSYGRYYFVSSSTGNDNYTGLTKNRPFASVQAAINAAISRGNTLAPVFIMAPGAYDETVTIPRTIFAPTFVGAGPIGSVSIAATTVGAEGVLFHADDVTFINVGVAGESTATYAIKGTGSRFRGFGCKFEGVDTSGYAFGWGPGTAAAVTAGTEGTGGDLWLVDCEFAWSFDGLNFLASDYGAATQIYAVRPKFHNISNICLLGTPGAFGIGSVRNLNVMDGQFDRMEDGTKPSDFVKVDDASDTGLFDGNRFALATNASADLKIGAKVFWATNATEAGWSTARPS